MKKTVYLLIIVALVLNACSHKPKFKKTPDGIEYYIIQSHPKAPSPKPGGGAVLDVKVYWKDSLMFNSRKDLKSDFVVMIHKNSYPGSIDHALQLLHQGDSAIIKLNAIKFLTRTVNMAIPKGMTQKDTLTFYLRLKKVLSPKVVTQRHNHFLKFRRDLEPKLIQDYIDRHPQYKFQLQPSGLYIAKVKPGHGLLMPQEGDSVYINYIGYFINGEPFASTLRRGQLFGWRIGDQKVIPGLELAVEQMKQGQVIFVIIPSYLAYGEQGLLDLIPPYAPLVFQVELVKIVPHRAWITRK